MVEEQLQDRIRKALSALNHSSAEIELEHPADPTNGDYSSNVAMVIFSKRQNSEKVAPGLAEGSTKRAGRTGALLAGATFQNPRELAEAIVAELQESQKADGGKLIADVQVAGPGFINFWLSEHFLFDELRRILDLGETYGTSNERKVENIIVEFTDPNPFKEFHIGHLYSNVVGESLARLMEATGATVKRANYQGDVGLHVAKAIWGMNYKLKAQNSKLKATAQNVKLGLIESQSLEERAKFLGECYAEGARAYEEDKAVKKEIEELNRKVYAQDPSIIELYENGRRWSLEYFETIYQRLGTTFDFYYFERDAGKVGLELVKKHLAKGVFEQSKGAIVFPGEKHGFHTRVFVNSQGLPTYEAKDLGLAPTKYKDFAYDKSIIITGNEVDEYFRVVLAAMRLVEPKLGERTKHISHGMVRLPGGKMSSRTGEVLTGEWLLDEAKRRVREIIDKAGSLDKTLQDSVAEMVGLGAVRYALLRSNIGRDIAFDFDESVSFKGDSGPYLQYTYARTRSVLARAKIRNQKSEIRNKFKIQKSNDSRNVSNFDIRASNLNAEELSILRWLYRYPEVVAQAAEEYSPNLVCGFLHELAGRYNTFYNKHRILQEKQQARRDLRLLLTAAVAQTLQNGLHLLGIEAPEKM